jgi:GNAT superfamily N-acetyltransferase
MEATMAEGQITIRTAEAGAIAALKQVLQETFEGTWLPHISAASAQRYVETDIGGRYADEHWRDFTVAAVEGEVAGLIRWRGDFIEAVHVKANRQGQGVGRALLAHAEHGIAAAGFEQARLGPDTFNLPAQRVYRSTGIWRRTAIPTTNGTAALPRCCSSNRSEGRPVNTGPAGNALASKLARRTKLCPAPPLNDLALAFKLPSRISYKSDLWRVKKDGGEPICSTNAKSTPYSHPARPDRSSTG